MSGGGIEAVLRDHVQVEGFDEIGVYWKYGCKCSWTGSGDDEHHVHVAAAVLAWLDARLTEGDVVEAMARAIGGNDKAHWWDRYEDLYRADATAALTAVRGVLGGEGS